MGRVRSTAQSIHQPIPVVSRFHRHPPELFLPRMEKTIYLVQIAAQLLMFKPSAVLIHNANHNVVAMQIDSCKYSLFHSVSFRFGCCLGDNTLLPEGNLPPPAPLMFISLQTAVVFSSAVCKPPLGQHKR